MIESRHLINHSKEEKKKKIIKFVSFCDRCLIGIELKPYCRINTVGIYSSYESDFTPVAIANIALVE